MISPDRRKVGRPKVENVSMSEDLRTAIVAMLATSKSIRWPSEKYQRDPVGFFRNILGIEPWGRQREVLEAVRDFDRVAVASGRRVSKSNTDAGIALWWYCSFPGARAVMSSTTARQVDEILWRELSMMRANSGRCVECLAEMKRLEDGGMTRLQVEARIPRPCPHSALIDGELAMIARTGLRSEDFREIKGYTARQAEAMQGIAGPQLLFIIDEASGVPQPIFDAISGNRAGGGKVLLTGNPTQNAGEFFDAFHSKSTAGRSLDDLGYHTIRISSEESPNVVEGRTVIPGLATREYIRERELEWGRDSAMFKIHVLGEFALNEEGRIFSVHAIQEAERRWIDAEAAGRLYIGLDPAGESGSGDDGCFVARRGQKMLELDEKRGLTAEGHLQHALAMMVRLKFHREIPVLVIDREGSIGAELYGIARGYLETHPGQFELVGVRASDRALRNPSVYDRQRDALAANLEAWINRDGGAILENLKLATELHELEWKMAPNGRLKVTPKDAIRKKLGRSPDRYDALALACWEPLALRDDVMTGSPARAGVNDRRSTDDDDSPTIDPYSTGREWWR